MLNFKTADTVEERFKKLGTKPSYRGNHVLTFLTMAPEAHQ